MQPAAARLGLAASFARYLPNLANGVHSGSGRTAANDNNTDYYPVSLKQDIAVVPQKDVLHESLRLEQALWYTGKLRLPPDTSRQEIKAELTAPAAEAPVLAKDQTEMPLTVSAVLINARLDQSR